jgi:hypothetical protein
MNITKEDIWYYVRTTWPEEAAIKGNWQYKVVHNYNSHRVSHDKCYISTGTTAIDFILRVDLMESIILKNKINNFLED